MFRTLAIYLFATTLVLTNITYFKSPTLGFIASVIYIYISSILCGNIFFAEEKSWTKILLGFSGFITLVSVAGAGALAFHRLSLNRVILLLVSITSVLVLLSVKQHGARTRRIPEVDSATDDKASNEAEKPRHRTQIIAGHLAVATYASLAVVSFLLLIFSRSDEIRVVWNSVHPAFLFSYFLTTFALFTVILSKISKKVKITLAVIHAFLAHSLLVLVFDQLVSGDPWHELGRIRDILIFENDIPNIFGLISEGSSPIFSVYYAFRKRSYHALVVIFSQMFSVDVSRIAVFLIPVLSSILVPLLMYKIVEIVGGKEKTPIIGALLTLSIPILIWLGAVGGAEPLVFIFFSLLVYLVLRYLSLNKVGIPTYAFLFLVAIASFAAHFRAGIMSITVFLLAIVFKKYESSKRKNATSANIQLLLTTLVCLAALPLALFALWGIYPQAGEMQVRFDMGKLLTTDILSLLFGEFVNFSFSELLSMATIFFFGIIGLIYVIVYAPKQRYRRSLSLFLLLLLVIFLVDYRILKYAMVNVPFSPERIWTETYFVTIPFAAIVISILLKETYNKIGAASSQIGKRALLKFGMITAIFCLAFSGLFTSATETGYSIGVKPPLLNVTPYEVETISFLHTNTAGRYVVICDAIFATAAWGILGFKSRATYYRYSSEYFQILANPSEEPLVGALEKSDSTRAYFVISDRQSGFTDIVERTKRVLKTYASFGDGKLFVFHYPPSEQEQVIPVIVNAGNYSRNNYPIDLELNFTKMLLEEREQGHIDPNSVRVIGPDGEEVTTQLDHFQALFDDCSTSGNWSEGVSDGDVLNYTLPFVGTTGIRGRVTYSEFRKDGGSLTINPQEYKYVEVKWKATPPDVSSIRVDLWYEVGNDIESWSTWTIPPSEWTVWRYDLSLREGTLCGLWFDIFSETNKWSGVYQLHIDWIRFIGDSGTVRFFYSGVAHTTEQYNLTYAFLEHTEAGLMDGLVTRSYPNPIRYTEDVNRYNFTWEWDDRAVNVSIEREASEWVGIPGKSLSYALSVDNENILTSDSNGIGGLGVKLYNSSDRFDANFSNGQLSCVGPIMAEVGYQTTEYGSLHVQLFKGQYPTIILSFETEDFAMNSNLGKCSWLISTNSSDDRVYYIKENGEIASDDLFGSTDSGNFQAQSISQREVHGYLIVLSSHSKYVGNYTANYNENGIAELDFLSSLNTGLNDADVVFVICNNQSLKEMKNVTLQLKNPPETSMSLPIDMSVRIVDLLNEPLDNANVEVKELGMNATTNSDGWAHFIVHEGQWTLLASKGGITNEKEIVVSSTNYVTRQRLGLVRIEGLVVAQWEFALIIGLIVIGIFSSLFLLHKKILAK